MTTSERKPGFYGFGQSVQKLINLNSDFGRLNGGLQIGSLSPLEQEEWQRLEARRHFYFKELLEARAGGIIDFEAVIRATPGENFHPFSRNKVIFYFEKKDRTITTSAKFIAAGGSMGTSEDVISLIRKGDFTTLEDEGGNAFALRTFGEIEDVKKAIDGNNQEAGDIEKVQRLRNLNASLIIRLLKMRLQQVTGERKALLPLAVIYRQSEQVGELAITISGLDADHGRTSSSQTLAVPISEIAETDYAQKITGLFIEIKRQEAALLSHKV